MTAPREPHRPPSPPDRLPSPRGGHPSSQTASAAARPAGFARLAGSVRTLAAAACLSLVGALLLPATVQAQDSDEVLLSNTGQDWEDGDGTNVSSAIVWAQGFTTGSNADGYHLSSIELNVERLPNTTADVTIALWSATSDSRPDASVATLTHSTGTWATGLNTFDAPADTELDTGTTYFVHMSYSGSGTGLNLSVTNSTSADAGGAPDWSVGQNRNRISGSTWSSPRSNRFRFKINGRAAATSNNAPEFLSATATREVLENLASGQNVGDAVTATDADTGDILTYTLEGTDASSFDIVSTSGQIQTRSGVTYNYEATQNSYAVVVKASDATASATIDVTINVGDIDEQPDTPAKPTLAAISGSSTKLVASWTEPGLNGGPEITGYQVRYRSRASATDPWSTVVDWPHTGTTTTTTITGLTADTEYQVDVSALNGEKPSGWSAPSDAVRTDAPTITDVAVTSTPRAASDTYGAGEAIEVTVTFTEAVTATTHTDFVLSVGEAKHAPLRSGSGTVTLVFGYIVKATDSAADGIWIGDQDRTLVGNRNGKPQTGTITSVPTGTAADLTHSALGELSGHKVDGRVTPPPPPTCTLNTGDRWCGVVTVGMHSAGHVGFLDNDGALTDNTGDQTIAIASGNYTVSSVVVLASPAGALAMELDRLFPAGDAATLEFHIGGSTFKVSEATDGGGGTNSYYWLNSGLSWSVGDMVDVRLRRTTEPLSTDATLSDLVVNDGSANLTLSPVFASGTTSYTASVANEVAEVTVTPTQTDNTATIEYLDGDDATLTDAGTADGHQVTLVEGDNVIKVKVTAADGNATETYMVTVTRAAAVSNNAPVFSGPAPTRAVPENSGAGTNVGAVIPEATDADADALTYSMEGTDATSFAFDASTRQIMTIAGVDYNYEARKNFYTVTVKASDATASATVDVTINVTDVAEQPDKPDKPTVAAVSGSSMSLVVSWTAPGLNGGPELTGYNVEYREGTTGTWTFGSRIPDEDTSAEITGLTADTEYQVRVQALNGETPSAWSDASDAVSTNAPATIPPGPKVTLQLSHDRILEFPSPVTVTATVSPASPVAFTVAISATPVAPATADDFRLSTNRVLRFAADATESTGTVRITPVDDDIPEPHDVVRVSGAVSNAAIEDPDDVTVEIINNDPEDYDVEVSAPPAVDEGAGAAVVTLTLTTQKNTAPVATVDMFFNVEGGTATRGDDYTPPPGRDFGRTGIHFASVQPSAFSPNAAGTAWVVAPSFTIGIIDDQEAEVAETIVFTVKFSEVETPAHTITIRDNDAVASDRPTDLQAAPRSPTVIQLAWTAPSAGSFSITGYRVEASENASGPWVVVAADTRNTRPSWGHGGLSAGDTRHYRVSAISPAGTSGPSTVASATTIAAGPAGTNAALPPPQDVNAEPKLPGEIRLSWWRNTDAASHELVDRYQYRYRVRDASTWTVDWTTVNQTMPPGSTEIRNANKVLLKGLTGGTTYEFQVRAVDKADGTSAAVSAVGTATGRQTVWIVADVGSVEEGEPLRFTVWRDQRHGPMVAIVRISETGDMLPPEGRSPEGLWHEQVQFGDGNDRIPLVLETVNDHGGTEPDSRVTVEVMLYPLYPDNPDNEHLYDVQPDLSTAEITVTAAAGGSSPGSVAEPLTAAFEGLPAAHDGETAFTFRLAFSEAVAVTPEAMRTRVLTVAGGAVTGAAPVAGASGVWAITVTPDSREELSIALAPATECAADGAVCTADDRALSNGVAAIVNGPGPETQTQPDLTAAFEGLPAAHDGERAFSFRVAFSDGISVSYTTVRDASFTVTGGEVTAARRVDGRRDLWEITIEPDSDEAVTVRLPETIDCGASGAICTGDGRGLSHSLSATVAGPADEPESNTAATGAPAIGGTPQVGEELTVSTSGVSDADGLDNASFGYQWIRADTDIGGATGSTYTPVPADEGKRLKVRVSFTDDAGHEESLTSAATDAVAAAPELLTASFEGMPAEHRGQGSFSFRVAFSEGISISYKTVRDASFRVTGGDVTQANRVDGRRDLWRITVEPDSDEAVTVRLPETTDCDASGAICTGDGRPLSHSLSATVSGPVGISVADARVEEGAGAVLEFAVTLSRAAAEQVTVDYQTVNGTAAAGTDYTAASGTLTFEAGESSKTIEVGVLDDAHDEGEETLTLRLSNASEGQLADAEATGTIENTDPLPRALLARFGRATALQVMEQVEERLEASRDPGLRGRFAGRELRRGMERDMGRNFLTRLQSTAVQGARDTTGVQSDLSGAEFLRTGLPGGGDLLMGSGFVLNRETGGGASVSLWSRGMESRFSGRDGELSLDGGVRTTMFGADYAKGPLMAGLMLSHRRGLGGYQGADVGQVASSVTGLHPWVGYKLTERVTLWGLTGYGRGSMSLTPGEALSLPTSLTSPASPMSLEGGLSMSMLAGGVRGDLVDSGVGGFGLAFKADALWVGTGSEAVDGPAGRLAGTEAVVTRVRTALEASRGYVFGHGIALRPSLELGLRRDGGDAETGAGADADVAASLIASDPWTGLSVDVRVRTLLVHQDEGFRERSVSVSFSYDPTPSTPLGLTARLAPSWGGQAMSGADALWGRDTMEGLGAGGPGSGDRIDAELGYALPVGSRLVGTPRFGVTTSEYGRDYRLGYSLAVVQGGAMSFRFGLDAQRRESLLQEKPDHSLVGRLTVGW